MGKGVAEDTPKYRTCRKGHPCIPENLTSQGRCLTCRKASNDAYRATRIEQYRAYKRAWKKRNPEKECCRCPRGLLA